MAIAISDVSPRIQYTASAGQTSFTVPFEFFADSNLVVKKQLFLMVLLVH